VIAWIASPSGSCTEERAPQVNSRHRGPSSAPRTLSRPAGSGALRRLAQPATEFKFARAHGHPMTNEHWRYFLTLDEDIEKTTRFVEPNRANFRTYSVEFVRLILSTCSEVDVVAKVLCALINPTHKAQDMNGYRSVITTKYPKIHTSKVVVDRFNLIFEPWKEWGNGVNPGWWRDHQNVKHKRHQNFGLADLEHCLNAAAGLFCLVLYVHHKDLAALQPKPRLFNMPTARTGGYVTMPDLV